MQPALHLKRSYLSYLRSTETPLFRQLSERNRYASGTPKLEATSTSSCLLSTEGEGLGQPGSRSGSPLIVRPRRPAPFDESENSPKPTLCVFPPASANPMATPAPASTTQIPTPGVRRSRRCLVCSFATVTPPLANSWAQGCRLG